MASRCVAGYCRSSLAASSIVEKRVVCFLCGDVVVVVVMMMMMNSDFSIREEHDNGLLKRFVKDRARIGTILLDIGYARLLQKIWGLKL